MVVLKREAKLKLSHHISERPEQANQRERIGDWEADTVAGVTGKACLVTLVDRKSRYLLCEKVAKKRFYQCKTSDNSYVKR